MIAKAAKRLNLERAPERMLWPAELLDLLWQHKHPRFYTCGITRLPSGEALRREFGMAPHGTVWFANEEGRDFVLPVRANWIPYHTRRGDQSTRLGERLSWHPERNCFVDDYGVHVKDRVTIGWRGLLAKLCKGGYLRNSPELSYLIGENTYDLIDRRYRL